MPACSDAHFETGSSLTTHTRTPLFDAWRNSSMASAPRMAGVVQESQPLAEFCSDVVVGLSHPGQKELPSKYLYDEVGSALFDVICMLPEYGLSRAGMRT